MARADDETQSLVTVRCGNCHGVFRNALWTPGQACTRCGSLELSPVMARGQSDYERADRSAGYALEDIRFGRLAQWAEFVTPKQVQLALHMQNQMARAGQKTPDLGAMLVREKLMDRKQVELVLTARRIKPSSKEDVELGQAAKRMGYVTDAQLAELFRKQEATDEAGNDAAPLPLMLVERRYVQENQMLALLKAAERQGSGLLYRMKRVPGAEEPDGQSLTGKLFGGSPGQRNSKIALAVLIPILVIILFSRVVVVAPVYATVKCTKCGAEFAAPADSNWPIKCPDKGEIAVYPLAMCSQCGARYPIVGIGYGAVCPKCRSSERIMLQSDNTEEVGRLLEKIKHKTYQQEVSE